MKHFVSQGVLVWVYVVYHYDVETLRARGTVGAMKQFSPKISVFLVVLGRQVCFSD